MDPILIVGGDNGEPYLLDPDTLETVGKLSDRVPILKGKKMLAHTRIDPQRQRLILCSSTFDVRDRSGPGGGHSVLEFFELDVNLRLVSTRRYETRFMVFHDWMLTDQYYVVPKNPAQFKWENLPQFLLGLQAGVEIFEMDYETVGELVLIPRHEPQTKAVECPADSFFNIFHFGPCFDSSNSKNDAEAEDHKHDQVTVYGAVFDKYKFGGEMGFDCQQQEFDPIRWSSNDENPAPRLDKFVLDTKSGTVLERQRIPLLDEATGDDVPVDMPNFNGDGAACRYSYFIGAERPEGWFPFRSVVKADLVRETTFNWDAGDDCICSEPMYLPRPDAVDEDDGFVVSIVHNASDRSCALVVFDSQRFGQGPIAKIGLGELMPWCVHGCWVPGYTAS